MIQFRFPHAYQWNRYELPVANLAAPLSGLKILHVTDLHFKSSWSSVYDRMIEQINSAGADLIVMTGDYNDRKGFPLVSTEQIRRFVTPLKARLGKFAIYGNHDRPLAGPELGQWGVQMIERTRVLVPVGDANLELIGLPGMDRIFLDRNFIRSMPPKKDNNLRIVLSHYPDSIRKVEVWKPDLFFAGHTHGGQICLPGGRAIIRHDSLPRPMYKGVHRWGDGWLIVSRGLGMTSIPIRLFAPPEILEVRVVGAV